MPAGELQPGDPVRRADGRVGVVESITTEAQPQPMWNLTVEGAHTYFVGAGEWLVHNSCPARVPDFADTRRAFEHYSKHVKGIEIRPRGQYKLKVGGADMPEFTGFAEYRAAARQFMSGSQRGTLEGTRRDGDLVRFDPATGQFGLRSPRGVIRTFFRPDDGIQYFYDQFR